MTQITTLLELRTKIKEKKPEFIRQDTHKRKRIPLKWKKPTGLHSKIRHHFKGRRKMPSPGYKSPAKVKGLHSTGLKIINVSSLDALLRIKKDSEGIVISGSVGARKRLELLRKANEMGIQVLNLNADAHIKKIEDFIKSKKKVHKEVKKEQKDSRTKEVKEGAKLTDEQKKEAEKKEKDKVLTQKV